MPSYLKAPLVTTVTPEIDVIEIVNPWGSRDELVPYSWREDAVTGLADVTTRGRHHPDYHWNYRMGRRRTMIGQRLAAYGSPVTYTCRIR